MWMKNKKLCDKRVGIEQNFDILKYSKESYWANVYHDTILDSIWLKNKSVSPGRWAVSYIALYLIYRILNEVNPTCILECGLGQSSKLTIQYSDFFHTNLMICENSKNWFSFFSKQFPTVGNYVKFYDVDKQQIVDSYKSNTYVNFDKSLDDKKFDFIFVDGPEGSEHYSRPNLLNVVEHLSDSFVILLDDFNRVGEQETWFLLKKMLKSKEIDFVEKIYDSDKSVALLCSCDLVYLTSL